MIQVAAVLVVLHLEQYFNDPRISEVGKFQLKETAISHSASLTRERQREKFNLEQKFCNILSRINSNTGSDHARLPENEDLLK